MSYMWQLSSILLLFPISHLRAALATHKLGGQVYVSTSVFDFFSGNRK